MVAPGLVSNVKRSSLNSRPSDKRTDLPGHGFCTVQSRPFSMAISTPSIRPSLQFGADEEGAARAQASASFTSSARAAVRPGARTSAASRRVCAVRDSLPARSRSSNGPPVSGRMNFSSHTRTMPLRGLAGNARGDRRRDEQAQGGRRHGGGEFDAEVLGLDVLRLGDGLPPAAVGELATASPSAGESPRDGRRRSPHP